MPTPGGAYGRSLADMRDPNESTPHKLWPAEEKLLQSVARGEKLPPAPRPVPGQSEDKRVRGSFIRFLALGGDEEAAVHERGVEVVGAFIEGPLHLEGAVGVRPLVLTSCWFDTELNFSHASVRQIVLSGSRVPSINATGLKVEGDLRLDKEFLADGLVSLERAQIGGELNCSGGNFHNSTKGGYALNAEYARITGNVYLSGGFSSIGQVRLLGLAVGADLHCWEGRFRNACPDPIEKIYTSDALDLTNARISGGLLFGPLTYHDVRRKAPIFEGSLSFQQAHARFLADDVTAWPQRKQKCENGDVTTNCIELDGFIYDTFAGLLLSVDAPTRLQWLERQRTIYLRKNFRPQPYEQLTKVLRAMGHDEDARIIAIQKQRRLHSALARRARLSKPLVWAKRATFGFLTAYGYRPFRLFSLLFILWLAAALFYLKAGQEGIFAPSEPQVFLAEHLEPCRPPNSSWTACLADITRGASPKSDLRRELQEYPPFNPFMYSLDVMIPFMDLHQRRAWAPMVKEMPIAGVRLHEWVPLAIVWAQALLGWSGALLLGAVLSGLVKRD